MGGSALARINIEDSIHAKPEFKRLVRNLGNEDMAIGMLYRFWRLAQTYWGRGELPIPKDEFESDGLQPIMIAGLAKETPTGIMALGADDHLGWYHQKVQAGKKRAQGARTVAGRFTSGDGEKSSGAPAAVQRPTSEPPAADQPLTLTPSPSPSEKEEEERKPTLSSVRQLSGVWIETLKALGVTRPRGVTAHEQIEIARGIRVHGDDYADRVLHGARHEPRTEGFDPGKNVSISRVLFGKNKQGAPFHEKFANLADQARTGAVQDRFTLADIDAIEAEFNGGRK